MKNNVIAMSHSFVFKYNKNKYTETEIVDGILANDDMMIRYIYKNSFSGIKSMVNSFHTLYLDAEDVFQEGLTRAVINVRENKFSGKSSFNTYLSAICRNVCLKEIQKTGKITHGSKSVFAIEDIDELDNELINRLVLLKDKMDEACKQIIDLRFGLRNDKIFLTEESPSVENTKFEEIAKKLNIETDNARQRFKRCFEKLKLALSNDHLWKELAN
jgi:RNA polymerase sigma factor (sigma-70 family)